MESYKSAKAITDWAAWATSSQGIADKWESLVLAQ
jgi:hypothetical protein